jgi:hypothetical protein
VQVRVDGKQLPIDGDYVPYYMQIAGLRAVSNVSSKLDQELLRFDVNGRVKIIRAYDVISMIAKANPKPLPVHSIMAFKKAASSGKSSPPVSDAVRYRNASKAIRASRAGGFLRQTGNSIAELISLFFEELRNIICKKRTGEGKAVVKGSTISSIATMLLNYFHITAVYATAVATAILFAIYNAGKKAFCRMRDKEAVKELIEQVANEKDVEVKKAPAKKKPAKKTPSKKTAAKKSPKKD